MWCHDLYLNPLWQRSGKECVKEKLYISKTMNIIFPFLHFFFFLISTIFHFSYDYFCFEAVLSNSIIPPLIFFCWNWMVEWFFAKLPHFQCRPFVCHIRIKRVNWQRNGAVRGDRIKINKEKKTQKREKKKISDTIETATAEKLNGENQINESDNSKWQKFIAVTDYSVIVHFYTFINRVRLVFIEVCSLETQITSFPFRAVCRPFFFCSCSKTYLERQRRVGSHKRKIRSLILPISKITVISLVKSENSNRENGRGREREKVSLIEMLTNQFAAGWLACSLTFSFVIACARSHVRTSPPQPQCNFWALCAFFQLFLSLSLSFRIRNQPKIWNIAQVHHFNSNRKKKVLCVINRHGAVNVVQKILN